MKTLCCLLLAISAQAFAAGYKIGDEVADFKLKNFDGTFVSLMDDVSSRGVMIVFTSNNCTTCSWYEDRIVDLTRKISTKGWKTIMINSCSTLNGPDDTFDGIVKRAEDKSYEFPYLYDSLQTVAKTFGAAYVPTIFLLKSTGTSFELGYVGTIDDAPDPTKKIHNKYVEWAVEALDGGIKPDTPMSKVSGCPIKFKN